MKEVIVSKFGGSSMADYEAMTRSAKIAINQNSNIVVVSAVYGVTNLLVELSKKSCDSEWNIIEPLLKEVRNKHERILEKLPSQNELKEKVNKHLEELNTLVKGIFLLKECSARTYDSLLSFGERLSSLIFTEVVKENTEKDTQFFDVRKVLITSDEFNKATPQIDIISKKCDQHLYDAKYGNVLFITQGFIGNSVEGHTTTLGRGGSDYSASLIAEGIGADILQIWTDVAGIATTDPRIVKEAKLIDEITYSEAAELATFGAKILHPTTLSPALRSNIKVFVGSSYEPEAKGTWIKTKVENAPLVRAMAKRTSQTLLTLSTPKMLDAHGFLFDIFKVFNDFKISVDSITTSEISVAVTIDNDVTHNKKFIDELSKLGKVKIENDLSLVSIIGNEINHTPNLARRIFSCLDNINVRMICLGASKHNFCFLVNEKQSDDAIRFLHKEFIS